MAGDSMRFELTSGENSSLNRNINKVGVLTGFDDMMRLASAHLLTKSMEDFILLNLIILSNYRTVHISEYLLEDDMQQICGFDFIVYNIYIVEPTVEFLRYNSSRWWNASENVRYSKLIEQARSGIWEKII